jgi:phage repressor protein C with HTH and peptisase S24 domain
MSKYLIAKEQLERTGETIMTVFGNSMMPILKSGSTIRFVKCKEYEVGDIVFCKVLGRYIDAHKIIKKNSQRGYLIANNHGHENGWTKTIYGKFKELL